MPSSGRAGISHPLTHTEESREHRILGRVAANPITWLQHQVEKTKGVSPETIAHIRGQLRKLVKRHGPLKSLPDDISEREYIRLAYRLNYMRTLEHVLAMKPTDKGYHIASKTLAIYASATIKFKTSNDKRTPGQIARKAVPSTSSSRPADTAHEAKGNAEVDGEDAP